MFCIYPSCVSPVSENKEYCDIHQGTIEPPTLASFEKSKYVKHCVFPGCTIIKEYRHPLCNYASHCWFHKTDIMQYKKAINICDRKCCRNYASFNYLGEKRVIYCGHHKKIGMVIIRKRSKKS